VPEITATHIAILVVALIIGTVIGWFGRGSRANSEKSAINDGWQEQLAAQSNEHERLLDQNKSLMEQNSQYQASNKDAKMRASELSDALKETFERRDELQRQLKDIRGNLEAAVTERNQLQNDMHSKSSASEDATAALQDKDERIAKLERELENWQDRLPPLIDKFRQRNTEAEELEQELVAARERIDALEAMIGSDQTRVEPVDPDAMTDGMDASNEPIDEEPQDDEPLDDEHPDDEPEELIAAEELEGTVEENDADEPPESLASNNGPRDDLKKIKGVGPAIEKTLNEMGICHFNQIAEMSEYEIDRVAHRLKGFRSRIYREDWIGQARDLYDQKVSGQL
jgi:predicted flap endonuclease-1-like 5' DNA nuclease